MSPRALDRAFALLSVFVAGSTAAFPNVTGYGTVLFQVIILTAVGLLEKVASDEYAAQHQRVVWLVASLVNVLVFWLIAVPVWRLTRTRQTFVGFAALIGLTAFYIGSLFWLFPAPDGP